MVLEWFNSECPFVQKHYESGNMQSLQKKYSDKGVVWLTINSTSPESSNYRDPARSQQIVKDWKIGSAALVLDPDGKVGQTYGARTTPHMWVIDPSGKVIYAGGIDDKATFRPADVKDAKNFVAAALDESHGGQGGQRLGGHCPMAARSSTSTDKAAPFGGECACGSRPRGRAQDAISAATDLLGR